MKTLKKEEDRKIRISISMPPKLHDLILDDTTNKSKYIEFAMLDYFKSRGINVSKIKL